MNALNNLSRPKKIATAISLLLVVAAIIVLAVVRPRSGKTTNTASNTDAPTASTSAPEGTGLAAHDKNGDGIVYQDGMHPWYVQDEPGIAPDCGMALTPVSVDAGQEEGTVRIDPVTLQNIGVRTAPVAVEALYQSVRTTGRFEANERLQAAVSPKVSGWVERLYVNYEGARVERGQPLLEIYSPELVSTQEEYLLALRNRERLEGTPAAEGAQRLVEAARRRLAYWDISDEQIRRLEQEGTPQKTLTLYSPASGTVTSTSVVQGQQVTAGETLMQLANLSNLWLMVDVYEQDLAWARVGTRASIELPYQPGRTLTDEVDYIYDQLDPATRTVKARVTVPNPGLQLKPGMYATVTLVGGETRPYPVVPEEALIRSGERAVVVLALGDGRFRPVEVTAGLQADGRVQILDGLNGGEEVVTSAQFLIDSEARLQSAVGAMVSGHDHGTIDGAGTGAGATPMDDMSAKEHEQMRSRPAVGPAAPPLSGGVQVVEITVVASGFEPELFELVAGVPARLVFTRTTDATCATQVQIPAFGIENTDLPLNKEVTIEFTPDESGRFTFACGMDMLKGAIIVSS